mmetsp:Transcript_24465/g.36694  ORF Transcript_24465/g.36694 Transcript_24465/m.36694 type:complete len:424 (-) Transcript_24465:95-1366(-)
MRAVRDWIRASFKKADPVALSQLESSRAVQNVKLEFSSKSDEAKNYPRYQSSMKSYQMEILDCIERNRNILVDILSPPKQIELGLYKMDAEQQIFDEAGITRVHYYGSKAEQEYHYGSNSSILHHLVKDWSTLRPQQWSRVHERIIADLTRCLRDSKSPVPHGDPPSILVPGCGLGRLVRDISEDLDVKTDGRIKAFVHGTESSMQCLRVIDTLFNTNWTNDGKSLVESDGESVEVDVPSNRKSVRIGRDTKNILTVHPFVEHRKNNFSRKARTKSITVPDIQPLADFSSLNNSSSLGIHNRDPTSEVSFSAMQISELDEETDAVVTCFYLDCMDPVSTISQVSNALRGGGAWINIGPLAFHGEASHSPTASELEIALDEGGFDLESSIELWDEDLPYYNRPEATIVDQVWRPIYFVARRRNP